MAIRSVTIEVDAPTFARWSSALTDLASPRVVTIRDAAPVFPAPPGSPSTVSLTGLELLLETGKAAALSTDPDDPGRLFALFKYALAFGPATPSGGLVLHDDVAGYDAHKKAMLSDDIGCGFAAIMAQAVCGATLMLDLHYVIRMGRVTTAATRGIRPDYIAFETPPSRTMHVVEAKGTQGPLSRCLRTQVSHGCDQVRSVNLKDPAWTIDKRFVVAAVLGRGRYGANSQVVLGDPDGVRQFDYEFHNDPHELCQRDHYRRVGRLIGDDTLDILSDVPRRQAPHQLKERQINGIACVGSELIVRCDRGEAGLFVGLAGEVHAQLAEGEGRAVNLGRLRARVRDLGPAEGHRAVITRSQTGTTAAWSIDGTVLETWSHDDPKSALTRSN